MVDSQPASRHSIQTQPSAAEAAAASKHAEQTDSAAALPEPETTAAEEAETTELVKPAAEDAERAETVNDEQAGATSSSAGVITARGQSVEQTDSAAGRTEAGGTGADDARDPQEGGFGARRATGAGSEAAAQMDVDGASAEEAAAEAETATAAGTGAAGEAETETLQDDWVYYGEEEEGPPDCEEAECEQTDYSVASTLGEDLDEASDIYRSSAMLVPIPAPDFSDLDDKEKLFPRPNISDPTVCYQLSCKQLNVVPISQYLRSIETGAEQLRFQSYGLARRDLLPLCQSLAYNTTAASLNLGSNRLEHDILPNIQAMMDDNSFIDTINLSRNIMTGPGLRRLQKLFTNNFTLAELRLSHCRLLDADAPQLAAVIQVASALRVLDLSHNEFSSSGKVFGRALAEDETLEEIDFGWNLFWSQSAKELLVGLKSNTKLRRLVLAHNSLGPDTVRALRIMLRKNAQLQELDVSHNRLKDPSMQLIATGMVKNSTIEKLWVGHNPVTPVGALALANSMAKMSAKYLDLSSIDVSADFIQLIGKLDPSVTVVHGTVHENMVLITPPAEKGARSKSRKRKKKKRKKKR